MQIISWTSLRCPACPQALTGGTVDGKKLHNHDRRVKGISRDLKESVTFRYTYEMSRFERS